MGLTGLCEAKQKSTESLRGLREGVRASPVRFSSLQRELLVNWLFSPGEDCVAAVLTASVGAWHAASCVRQGSDLREFPVIVSGSVFTLRASNSLSSS